MNRKLLHRAVPALLAAVGLVVQLSACVAANQEPDETPDTDAFLVKAELLRGDALADWVRESLDESPAGQPGYMAFFSVSDGTARAAVYSGMGDTLDAAWDAAANNASAALRESGLSPRWVKADLIYHSETLSAADLSKAITQAGNSSFRYGLAFDEEFHTALLEGELNGAGIYDYDAGAVSLDMLNRYLEESGRERLADLPESYQVFGCASWLCDEENTVWGLDVSGPGTGRREPGLIDGDSARQLVSDASAYLAGQIKEDGSFVYGIYSGSGQELEGYNMLHHAGALWALVQGYRIAPERVSAEKLQASVEYMLNQTGYDAEGRAFLCETQGGEIKLGGNALALIALTEYTETFQDVQYLEDCRALGGGIIAMLDPETGKFIHVLNGDLTPKETFRTIYYDGEAVYALARLYGLTGEEIWLQGAQIALDQMIAEDRVPYKDQWFSYALNEVTKYTLDRPDYYQTALENAQKNLKDIYEQETAEPGYLELLLSAFEVYDRLTQMGGNADGFDPRLLLGTIYVRADRQLDGLFYPEYAIYMSNPQQVLHTFMSRQNSFRVRIDDVQHNISGYYLYAKNYDRLLAYGLLENGN